MKIIDLLNKIANGEDVPKKIKYDGYIWVLREDFNDYWNDDEYMFLRGFDDYENARDFLNDELEIIEEDKEIEKLGMFEEAYCDSAFDGIVFKKINQLIDIVNELKKEGK